MKVKPGTTLPVLTILGACGAGLILWVFLGFVSVFVIKACSQ